MSIFPFGIQLSLVKQVEVRGQKKTQDVITMMGYFTLIMFIQVVQEETKLYQLDLR